MTAQHYKTFYILDLDRTLYDTERGAELLVRLTEPYDRALGAQLRSHMQELMAQKAWFSMYDFIRTRAGDDVVERMKRLFLERAANEQLLLPRASDLIERILASGSGLGILTYGSTEVQNVKLQAMGFDRYGCIITDQTEKGAMIASWYDGTMFKLPPEYGSATAETIVFVDDRDFSFIGFPNTGARGYWIKQVADAQLPTGVESVREVRSLQEVIDAEPQLTKA